MGLSKGVISALVQRKIKQVLPEIQKAETTAYDRISVSSKVKEIISETIEAQNQIEALSQQLGKWDSRLKKLCEAITAEFKKAGLEVSLTGATSFSNYELGKPEFRMERISLDSRVSSDYSNSEINAQSELARKASEKLKAAILDLQVALETNNRAELLKLVEGFNKLKLI
jgi:hypothetical protein